MGIALYPSPDSRPWLPHFFGVEISPQMVAATSHHGIARPSSDRVDKPLRPSKPPHTTLLQLVNLCKRTYNYIDSQTLYQV
ncbi:hypothetical protein NT6N_37070 [Oceaniferula spumae]|uniref:Uncharacterized protein n=1 Tax=Oceaniferula spumae TaxID=2979115 RepID=A0AAT9FRP6_9BACT